jgi:hypothetical protein
MLISLGKSRHYFEQNKKDQGTAKRLQQIRLRLIQQAEKKGFCSHSR